ncbi:MAG: hypothetical protein U9O98_09865 [Asgard group archaeon]|nr:hypothetical protein [Asgard group archaeon]
MYDNVKRLMDIDFIYLDLILVSIWILLLVIRKHFKALLFGVFGFGVVFFTDDVLWFHLKGTRHIDAPIQPDLFLLYFSFTYGMIMFSYAPIMFDEKVSPIEKVLWSIFMYGGWLTIALLSQYISWNDTAIVISRDMSNSRIGQIIMLSIGYLVLILLKALNWKLFKKIPWWYFGYLFLVGIFIHFSMESTLWIANIRPSHWDVLLFNSLVEFNTGIPILYFLWVIISRKDYLLQLQETEEKQIQPQHQIEASN